MKRYVCGVQYELNVKLVIKNCEKTPQQERVLACICKTPINHGLHVMCKFGMDVLMIKHLSRRGLEYGTMLVTMCSYILSVHHEVQYGVENILEETLWFLKLVYNQKDMSINNPRCKRMMIILD